MKVLLIDVNCGGSSTGKIVYDLFSFLNKNGNQAAICYGRGKKIKEKNIYKFGIDLETYFHAFLTRITGYTGCYSFFSTLRLIRYIKKFKPDVIHIHELHAYFINIKQFLNYIKKMDIKVIHTLHCSFSYTGKCGHHLNCDKWKTVCRNCPRIHDYVKSFFFDKTEKMFISKKKSFDNFKNLTIVTPSLWLANYVRKSFLRQYQINTIYNGIDTSVFRLVNCDYLKKLYGIKDGEKIILAVAPNLMSKSKGGFWVVELAKQLALENMRFILIGVENPSEINEKNVIALNKINDQKLLAQYYSLATRFVICSEMENFPTTCLESQCCGTPICGFDVGGTKETTVIDESGAFVNYGEIEKLSCFLKQAKNIDKNIISTKAIQKFGNNRFESDYLNIYMEN